MPLLFRQTAPLRGVWATEESPEELLSLLGSRADCLEGYEKLRAEKRKTEWLAVRVLLKELLGEESPIAYRPEGAPFLPEKPLFISISHTKGYAAVVLNEHSPAGIDIEYRSERVLKVSSRFLSEEEERFIDPAHRAAHLLICWCAKEALFKRIGRQGVDLRKHLHIPSFPYQEAGSLLVRESFTPQAAVYPLHYLINKYFAMAWFLDITFLG